MRDAAQNDVRLEEERALDRDRLPASQPRQVRVEALGQDDVHGRGLVCGKAADVRRGSHRRGGPSSGSSSTGTPRSWWLQARSPKWTARSSSAPMPRAYSIARRVASSTSPASEADDEALGHTAFGPPLRRHRRGHLRRRRRGSVSSRSLRRNCARCAAANRDRLPELLGEHDGDDDVVARHHAGARSRSNTACCASVPAGRTSRRGSPPVNSNHRAWIPESVFLPRHMEGVESPRRRPSAHTRLLPRRRRRGRPHRRAPGAARRDGSSLSGRAGTARSRGSRAARTGAGA